MIASYSSSHLHFPVVTPPEFFPHPVKLLHHCQCLCLMAEMNLQ